MRLSAAERKAIRKITSFGGRKRMASMTAHERSRLGTKAVMQRWANHRAAKAVLNQKQDGGAR
jgi:hypothetical protein